MADRGPGKDRADGPAGGNPPPALGVAAGAGGGEQVLGGPAAAPGRTGPPGSLHDGLVRTAAGVPRGDDGGAVRTDSAPGRTGQIRPWNAAAFSLTVLGSLAIWAVLAGLCLLVGSTGVG